MLGLRACATTARSIMVLNRGLRCKYSGWFCSGQLLCYSRAFLMPSAPLVWCLLWVAGSLPGSLLVPTAHLCRFLFFLTEEPFMTHIARGLAENFGLSPVFLLMRTSWGAGAHKKLPLLAMVSVAPSTFVCLETPLLLRPYHIK